MVYKKNYFKQVLLLILIILFSFYLFKVLNSNEFRYGNLSCNYKQIYKNVEKPDILFFGTSRMLSAIDPKLLEEYILSKKKIKTYVVNASNSWKGYGIIRRQLIDFIDNKKKPKIIVVEISDIIDKKINLQNRFLRKNLYYEGFYPQYEKVAKYSDFILDVKYINENIFIKLHVFLELYSNKINYLIENKKVKIKKKNNSIKKCYKEDNQLKIKHNLIMDRKIEFNDITLKNFYKKNEIEIDFENQNHNRSTKILKNILMLSEHNNIKVFFVRVPRIFQPPLSKASKQKFKNIFGKNLYSLNIEELDKLYNKKNSYRDGTHMISNGRKIFTKYIGDYIISNVYK